MASKFKQFSKEKARERSIARYCQNCAGRRREPGSARNGVQTVQSKSSSIMFQKELERYLDVADEVLQLFADEPFKGKPANKNCTLV